MTAAVPVPPAHYSTLPLTPHDALDIDRLIGDIGRLFGLEGAALRAALNAQPPIPFRHPYIGRPEQMPRTTVYRELNAILDALVRRGAALRGEE